MTSEPRALLRPSPDALAQEVEGDIVLVHLQTNQMYQLNQTGARLWQLLQDGCGRDEIHTRLCAEFEVDERQLSQEIDALLAQLAAERLVVSDSDH